MEYLPWQHKSKPDSTVNIGCQTHIFDPAFHPTACVVYVPILDISTRDRGYSSPVDGTHSPIWFPQILAHMTFKRLARHCHCDLACLPFDASDYDITLTRIWKIFPSFNQHALIGIIQSSTLSGLSNIDIRWRCEE